MVNTDSPIVSVVIPVRNGAQHLTRAVKSVEVLAGRITELTVSVTVIDDGSPRPLRPDLDLAASQIPIELVAGQELGPCAARNLGASSAVGDFVIFLDVDDVLLPGWLTPLALLSTHLAEEDPTESLVALRGPALIADVTSGLVRTQGPSWLPGAYLVSKALFWKAGGFDERRRWGEHHELGDRIEVQPGVRVVNFPFCGPLVQKYDNRSASVVIGYAMHRLDAADLDRKTARDPSARAEAADVVAVSQARLGDWTASRAAAHGAWTDGRSLKRLLRFVVLGIPGARWLQFSGTLRIRDARGRVQRMLESLRLGVQRKCSFVRALIRFQQ